jgi:uncharacterized protein (TIGR00290 family)
MQKTPAERVFCSWSGGKDSCLAFHVAGDAGAAPEVLVSMFEPCADRNRSHGVPEALIAAQAQALGVELRSPRAAWLDYERVFASTLAGLRAEGFGHGVFGDIDLEAHRAWEERLCSGAGMRASLPLWQWPRARVVAEVFARGIDAVCVCVNTRYLPATFCGRRYDADFVAALPPGVDACGENGEFHTFVTDAPRFRRPVTARVAHIDQYVAPAAQGGDAFVFARLVAG